MVISILAGLVFLYFGGESLVKGASTLGLRAGVKPIVIGLTVVAFGTSSPEFFVSFFSSLQSKPELAAGNIVGSNIFNLAFILGLSAVVRPLKVDSDSIRREIPFLIGSCILIWIFGRDGQVNRWEGLLLLSLFVVFLLVCFKTARRNGSFGGPVSVSGHYARDSGWIIVGLILLVLGSWWLVRGSIDLARTMGASELAIGLTLVAAGTSLPELFTSVVAARRGRDDLSVGNITGSNIFNVLFILGACAVVFPISVSPVLLQRDIPAMTAVSVLAVPLMKSGFVINRWEGTLLLACYAGYVVFISAG